MTTSELLYQLKAELKSMQRRHEFNEQLHTEQSDVRVYAIAQNVILDHESQWLSELIQKLETEGIQQ